MILSILSKICRQPSIKTAIFSSHLNCRSYALQCKSVPILNPKNNFQSKRTFFKFFKKPSVKKLKEVDDVPDEYILIYRNAMNSYLRGAQMVCLVSAAAVGFLVLFSSQWEFELTAGNWRLDSQPELMKNEITIYASLLILLCATLYMMIHRMPIRIYNYPRRQEYVFIFYGFSPTSQKRLVCKVNDVIRLEPKSWLPVPLIDHRYEILQQRRIIMMEDYFRKPSDLNVMLGYEKQSDDYD